MLKILRRVTAYDGNVPGGYKGRKKLRVQAEFSQPEPTVGVQLGNYLGACYFVKG